jgi:hypothetical protein
MLTDSDLNAPAHLAFGPAGTEGAEAQIDWNGARSFDTLREALHRTMTEEAPAGQLAFLRTSSGRVLPPEELETLYASLQGP